VESERGRGSSERGVRANLVVEVVTDVRGADFMVQEVEECAVGAVHGEERAALPRPGHRRVLAQMRHVHVRVLHLTQHRSGSESCRVLTSG
jgi:hypothetical protein